MKKLWWFQLGTVFSSLLLLSVIFLLGRFMEVLPVCFLSCIIIVALKGMFMQLGTIASLWHVSKYDCVSATRFFYGSSSQLWISLLLPGNLCSELCRHCYLWCCRRSPHWHLLRCRSANLWNSEVWVSLHSGVSQKFDSILQMSFLNKVPLNSQPMLYDIM